MEKKIYCVTIEETVVQDFKIEAESAEKAEEIAEDLYNEGKIVLETPDVIGKKMLTSLIGGSEYRGWREF